MSKFLISLSVLVILSGSIVGQTTKSKERNEEYYSSSFQYEVKEAGLTFGLPKGYHVVEMKDCNSGYWRCTGYLEPAFLRVFMSGDSNVVVGIRLASNYRMMGSNNREKRGNVDWLENARKIYSYQNDSSLQNNVIDKAVLQDFWTAEYGVKYTRKCQNPFMDGYAGNIHVLIANKDLQISMVFIYKDEFKHRIESVISKTITQILRKI